MTWELPWITSGIDELPVATARTLAYASTDGRSGVIGGNDLKVTAKSPASNEVEIAPGALVAGTRFTTAAYESYIGRNLGADTITIPSVGGSSRYDFVYAHITDPGQAGEPATAAPIETRVITGVSSTAVAMSDVPALAGKTGVPLARIFRAPSASIVNPGDITDIRSFLTSGLVGEIKIWGSNAAPSGWLVCNGAAVSRSTYSALYSVIGTTFGVGDGATTFNLPNFTDRFPIGTGTKTLGSVGGSTTAPLPDHVHNVAAHSHGIPGGTVPSQEASNTTTGGNNDRVTRLTNDGQHNHGGVTQNNATVPTSGATSFPNITVLNPWLAVTFIINAI